MLFPRDLDHAKNVQSLTEVGFPKRKRLQGGVLQGRWLHVILPATS